MKHHPFAALIIASACSVGTGSPPGSPDPVPLSGGDYTLVATVEYRQDTETESHMTSEAVSATLTVDGEGRLSLSDDFGPCREITPPGPRGDGPSPEWRFRCERAEYALDTTGGRIRGELIAFVMESVRLNLGCAQFRVGTTECEQYRWRVNRGQVRKGVPLRIHRNEAIG